ncbi:MAG: hypothetical protein OXI05_12810, partial [Bacteroidota bacterium]|nr:hypothetical protein [Bacteroidota bacterium]
PANHKKNQIVYPRIETTPHFKYFCDFSVNFMIFLRFFSDYLKYWPVLVAFDVLIMPSAVWAKLERMK